MKLMPLTFVLGFLASSISFAAPGGNLGATANRALHCNSNFIYGSDGSQQPWVLAFTVRYSGGYNSKPNIYSILSESPIGSEGTKVVAPSSLRLIQLGSDGQRNKLRAAFDFTVADTQYCQLALDNSGVAQKIINGTRVSEACSIDYTKSRPVALTTSIGVVEVNYKDAEFSGEWTQGMSYTKLTAAPQVVAEINKITGQKDTASIDFACQEMMESDLAIQTYK